MQETKKKVLEGNTSGNLLNYLVFREQSVPKQKQPNDSPMLQLWSNMWSKKFRNSGWCESGGKTRDFAPEMQKIKPKTVRFRLYLVCVPRLEPAAHYREPPKRARTLWGTPYHPSAP